MKTAHIAWGAQAALGNDSSTALPTGGVVRDFKPLPSSWNATLLTINPLMDLAADTYEAAFLKTEGQALEYLVWAANSSKVTAPNATTLDCNDTLVSNLGGVVPHGKLTVGSYHDGVNYVSLVSEKSLQSVLAILVKRGDTGAYYVLTGSGVTAPVVDLKDSDGNAIPVTTLATTITSNPSSGVVTLNPTTLNTTFGGALSSARGDTLVRSWVVFAPQTFWWTRNDSYEKRFDYNSKLQRWEPLKGGSVRNVGVVQAGISYQLSPALTTFALGDYLFGDDVNQDAFSVLRVGLAPNKDSLPLAYRAAPAPGQFSGVRVVADDTVDTFAFSGADSTLAGVVGLSTGKVVLNPTFIALYAGETLWYSPLRFGKESGKVGALLSTNYLAPVPGPNQYPFLRVGSRKYLTTVLFATDTLLLAAANPAEQEVYVSLSTGLLRFSTVLLEKADPLNANFDPAYLGEAVYYDGVALNTVPQPLCAAQQIVDSNGAPISDISAADALYIPSSDPFAHNGLGISGIHFVQDNTGALARWTANPPVRAGGDNETEDAVGIVRRLGAKVGPYPLGEDIVYTTQGALSKISDVNYISELPSFNFTTDVDTAYIAEEGTPLGGGIYGSELRLNDDAKNAGPAWYLNTHFTPSQTSSVGLLVSFKRQSWTFSGSEKLYFAVDGVSFRWTGSVGTFTAQQVQTSLYNALRINNTGNPDGSGYKLSDLATAKVTVDRDYLCLQGQTSVQVGSGAFVKDLSGCAALGFLPGWRMDTGATWWCRDTGYSFGVDRNPNNLTQESATPDFRSHIVFNGAVSNSIQGMPFQSLDYAPLRDSPGYGQDQYFRLIAKVKGQTVYRYLENLVDIHYDLEKTRFDWLAEDALTGQILQPVQSLALGHSQVVPETLLGCEPNPTSGLRVSLDGQSFQDLTLNTDYLLNAITGEATLIDRVGATKLTGFLGAISVGSAILGNTFGTGYPNFSTASVSEGDRLRVHFATGYKTYYVTGVADSQHITVEPAFTETATGLAWTVYTGKKHSEYDKSILTDAAYVPFSPLPADTFKVRLLSPLGNVPLTGLLSADIAKASQTGRRLSLRFAKIDNGTVTAWKQQIADTSAQLIALQTHAISILQTSPALFLPDITSTHYTQQAFQVQVGARLFTHGTDLDAVSVFTNPVPAQHIEYLTSTGELRFGSTLLATLQSQMVSQLETFSQPSQLGKGIAEYNLAGQINLSETDRTAYGKTPCWLCEELSEQDYTTNPVAGSFVLNSTLREFQMVEVNYYQANPSGEQASQEYLQVLPFYCTRSQATRISSTQYSFNPLQSGQKHSLVSTVLPTVWVDDVIQNYSEQTTTVDMVTGTIQFNYAVLDTATVLISYATQEALGGERTFTVPNGPIWNPPFFLSNKVKTFTLDGDRTQDFKTGTLFRINNQTFWVKEAQYNAQNSSSSTVSEPYLGVTGIGQTSITLFPDTAAEIGSRSPANPALCLLSDRPLCTSVEGVVTTQAQAGFLLPITTAFKAVNRGENTISFAGTPLAITGTTDPLTGVSAFQIQAGMLLNLGGEPYVIADSKIAEDGLHTILTVASAFTRGYSPTEVAQISARPVYPTGARIFLPLGGMLPSESVELVRYSGQNPGETLVQGVDWKRDTNTGIITLLGNQPALAAGEQLEARWTAVRTLKPFLHDGTLIQPVYQTQYRYNTTPSVDNGLLGASLEGKYTFLAPDSFYGAVEPVASYEGTFVQEVSKQTQQNTGLTNRATTLKLSQLGIKSAVTEWQELQAKDRIARGLLSFYNDTIVSFEQVLETVSGTQVGERDGKFRFNVQQGLVETLPPGSEDPITGLLNPRNVFSDVFALLSGHTYPILLTDRIVDPASATLFAGQLDGDTPDSYLLNTMLLRQKSKISNDIDDIVLTGTKRLHVELLFHMYRLGDYRHLYRASAYSRLFPEQTTGIFLTQPGLESNPAAGVPGFYSPFHFKDWGIQSTFMTPIAQVSNPVLENLTSLTSISIRARMPRARIWGYFSTGIPANVLQAGQPAINEPCVICTPLDLATLPISPATGYPDASQFIAQGGSLMDLTTGDFETLAPYWKQAQYGIFAKGNALAVEFGEPSGILFGASVTEHTVTGELTGLYVKSVLYGCVLTFQSHTGVTPTANTLLRMTSAKNGVPLSLIQGDTITVHVRKDASDDLYQTQDYRDNFDVYTRFSDGQVLDITMPEFLQGILKQRPPQPVEYLEAQVSFGNSSIEPLDFPALQGKNLLDSGDHALPYVSLPNTELTRFGQINNAMSEILLTRSPMPNQYYVYPDEVLSNDGSLLSSYAAGQPPATLLTTQSYTPVGTGKGSVQPYDLLLVQTPTGNPVLSGSAEGFQSISEYAVSGGKTQVSVPRFWSQTKKGAEISYALDNAMAFVSPVGGVQVVEDQSGGAPNGAAGKYVTLLDFGGVGLLTLDDGQPAGLGAAGIGGLNRILAAHASNTVTIRVYTVADTSQGGVDFLKGDFVEEFIFSQAACAATVAGTFTPGTTEFGWNNNHKLLRFVPTAMIPAGSIVDLPNVGTTRFGTKTENPAGVWTTDASFCFSVSIQVIAGYSQTAFLKPDRLTFAEMFDLSLATERGTVHPDAGWDLQTKLRIDYVRVKNSAGVLSWADWRTINGMTSGQGCPFTFLTRDNLGTIGTFTPASASGAGDEEGTLKAMPWEGIGTPGHGANITANIVGGQVTSFNLLSGGTGYTGGFVELVLSAPPAGRTATAIATVTAGVITASTLKLPGNGYVVAPSVTVKHWAGNQSLGAIQDCTVSAIPSSPEDTAGVIGSGIGVLGTDPILTNPSVVLSAIQSGDIVTVASTTDVTYIAAVHTGTSLVRHSITPDVLGTDTKEVDFTCTVGDNTGWAPSRFPQVQTWDEITRKVTVDSLFSFGTSGNSALPSTPHSWVGDPDWGSFPEPARFFTLYGVFPRVYCITVLSGGNSEVVSMEYSGGNLATHTFNLVAGTARDKDWLAIADSTFFASLSQGLFVSGFTYVPVQLSSQGGLPDNNIAVDLTAGTAGFRTIHASTTVGGIDFAGAALQDIDVYTGIYAQPAAGILGCNLCLPKEPGVYVATRQEAVYTGVQAILDFSGLVGQATLNAIHTFTGVRCLIPGDALRTANGMGGNALPVRAGVYLEPSFARPGLPVVGGPYLVDVFQSLAGTNPVTITAATPHGLLAGSKIAIQEHSNDNLNGNWDVSHILNATSFQISYDNTLGGLGVGGSIWAGSQSRIVDAQSAPQHNKTVGVHATLAQNVAFNVRRLRRFHDKNAAINSNFSPLRYAYEIRRGRVTSYTTIVGPADRQIGILTAQSYMFPSTDPDYLNGKVYTGTQLGGFLSSDVGIQAGDIVRIIDPTLSVSQQVVGQAEVLSVVSNGTLKLASPGITHAGFLATPANYQFQVFLKQSAPHQQSCEQLFERMTDSTVRDLVANRTTLQGGYVTIPAGVGAARIAGYDTEVNKLRDDTVADFRVLSIQVGDIVVIDPASLVGSNNGVPEYGTRPFGDIGISARGAAYQAGRPNFGDDNRGHFWVKEIHQDYLLISGVTEFAGTRTSEVTFPAKLASKAIRGYAVLPTIHDSAVTTNGIEGQGDLRPTQDPGYDDDGVLTGDSHSYSSTHYSIRPFSYRIIRPSGKLSTKAINLILTMRERMLSLIELFKGAMDDTKSGDYHDFQEFLFGRDLGYLTLAETGMGVFRNALIEDLQGRLGTTPYTNDADALSVLDRRFWVQDARLERLTSDGTGYGMRLAPPGTPYADYTGLGADVRPVLPDLIENVLSYRDKLRDIRFSWIVYRVHRTEGSLAAIQRFEENFAAMQRKILTNQQQRRSFV